MAAFENLFYVDCCGMKIDKGRAPPLRVNRLIIWVPYVTLDCGDVLRDLGR